MTSSDSLSPAESSMGDSSIPNFQTLTTSNKRLRGGGGSAVVVSRDESDSGEGGAEMWKNFTDSFREVQSVLDRNRALIKQVNENHQSKIHDNMVKNVGLIHEINSNISKVVSLYSDLSTNFSSVFHQQREAVDGKDSAGGGNNVEA